MFRRILETNNPQHLDKLASVIEALKVAPQTHLREPYRRYKQLFQAMYNVADAFTKDSTAPVCEQLDGSALDPQFALSQSLRDINEAFPSSAAGNFSLAATESNLNLMDIESLVFPGTDYVDGVVAWSSHPQAGMLLDDNFNLMQ